MFINGARIEREQLEGENSSGIAAFKNVHKENVEEVWTNIKTR